MPPVWVTARLKDAPGLARSKIVIPSSTQSLDTFQSCIKPFFTEQDSDAIVFLIDFEGEELSLSTEALFEAIRPFLHGEPRGADLLLESLPVATFFPQEPPYSRAFLEVSVKITQRECTGSDLISGIDRYIFLRSRLGLGAADP